MSPVAPPPLTWLYVPADRPERVQKALASGAHAVIVDLEDAVAPAAKAAARAALDEVLAEHRGTPVHVRVNGLATPWFAADVEAAAALPIDGLLAPKVETRAEVDRIAERLPDRVALRCLVESALGIENAFAIAAHERVAGVGLGEADLGGETGASGAGLDWARSRLVNAACAAGLPRPPQSIYAAVRDLDGLAVSCAHGRALGHLGRTAIHPAQLPVILAAYLPSDDEAAKARALVDTFARQGAETGAFVVDGAFVDVAMVRAADMTVALADAYGTRSA